MHQLYTKCVVKHLIIIYFYLPSIFLRLCVAFHSWNVKLGNTSDNPEQIVSEVESRNGAVYTILIAPSTETAEEVRETNCNIATFCTSFRQDHA